MYIFHALLSTRFRHIHQPEADTGAGDTNENENQRGRVSVRPRRTDEAAWGDSAALRAAPFTALGGSLVGLPGMVVGLPAPRHSRDGVARHFISRLACLPVAHSNIALSFCFFFLFASSSRNCVATYPHPPCFHLLLIPHRHRKMLPFHSAHSARQVGALDLARDGAFHHHLLDQLCARHSDSVLESNHVWLVAVLLPNAARTSSPLKRMQCTPTQIFWLVFSIETIDALMLMAHHSVQSRFRHSHFSFGCLRALLFLSLPPSHTRLFSSTDPTFSHFTQTLMFLSSSLSLSLSLPLSIRRSCCPPWPCSAFRRRPRASPPRVRLSIRSRHSTRVHTRFE